MTAPRLVVIGNPDNRRVTGFVAEAERLGLDTHVLSYLDLHASVATLEDLPDVPTLVRIESYGECHDLVRKLLDTPRLPEDRGRIDRPAALHRAYLRLLARIERVLATKARWSVAPSPADIRLLFDKQRLHRVYRQAGLPVPAALRASDYDQLRAAAVRRRWPSVFVKLRCGSSASGVGLLRWAGRRVVLYTTVERVGRRYYNSLRLQRYTDERDVAGVVNFLAGEGLHVEREVPRARLGGRVFDLRVLVVMGQPVFRVVRTSRGPLTNLHLGNARGDPDAVRRLMGRAAWDAMHDTARRAAALHDVVHLGTDIAVCRDGKTHVVLEANAFGDLLPGLTYRRQPVYRHELRQWLRAVGAPDGSRSSQ